MKKFDETPIRLRHIATIQEMLRINAMDMAWLLGASPSRWGSIIRDTRLDPTKPVDPCRAMILRWLIQHPESSPTLHAPDASCFLKRLRNAIGDLPSGQFSILLGWDATAGSRWTKNSSRISPAGRRALSLLDTPSPKRLANNWFKWSANAALEARLRGIDLTSSLGWSRTRAALEANS